MGYKIYTDFILGDSNIKLSDFGGMLYNEDNAKINLLPSHSINSEKYGNMDGEYITSTSLEPRPIELNMYFENGNLDIKSLTQWLYNDKKEQWFQYVGDNKRIRVIYKDEIIINVYGDKSTINTVLYAYDPYWYSMDNTKFVQERPMTNQLYTFNNPSVDVCYPLIKLEVGDGVTVRDVIIEINGERIKLANINTDIYLDSKYRTCYTYVVGEPQNKLDVYEYAELGKHRYYFPVLKPQNNTFKLVQGAVTKVTIETNSRILI